MRLSKLVKASTQEATQAAAADATAAAAFLCMFPQGGPPRQIILYFWGIFVTPGTCTLH